MKESTIGFNVTLDKDNVPEKIQWHATDNPAGEISTTTKAVSIALWDDAEKHSLRIDLWTKDMPVDEMKRFYVECIAGLADSVIRSTNDETMGGLIHNFCEQLVEYIKKNEEPGS